MRVRWLCMMVALAGFAGGCGDEQTEPVTQIDVVDVRERQARSVPPPQEVMALMLPPEGPGRIIYEPPTDLTLSPSDSAVTAPFGITAAPDSAGHNPAEPAPRRGQRDPARDVRGADTSQRNRAGQDTSRRPR